MCGVCDGTGTGQCDYSSGGPKGNAFCIEPLDGCAVEGDPLTVLFKPGGKNCEGTFILGDDEKCPNGWYVSRPTTAGLCNGGADSDEKITNLDILDTSTCGAATIHTSCSCDLALCDEFGDYRLTGAILVDTDPDVNGLLITSK